MYECTNVGLHSIILCVFYVVCLWAVKQYDRVYVNVCVCVSTSCIIQMAWGYSLSCLQENSSREKHAALSVSLCSSSQKQRGKSERHIHQLPAFFFLTALPFDTFSFFLFIALCINLSTLFTGVSAMIPAEIADNWNRQLEVQKWSYSPVSVGYKSREHHLHPKHRITW